MLYPPVVLLHQLFFIRTLIMILLFKKIRLLILPLVLTACTSIQPYIPGAPYGVNVNPAPRSYSNNYYQQPQQPYYVKPKHSEHHDYNEHHDNGKHKGQHKNKHDDD